MSRGPYEIRGRYLSAGEETPHFEAELLVLGVSLARITSDGRGGAALVEWAETAPRGGPVRAAAVNWLEAEARQTWARLCPEDPPLSPALARDPAEAAILVVPEYLGRSL